MANSDTLRKLLKEYARFHIDLASGESGLSTKAVGKIEDKFIKRIERASGN